ncbi:MAG TPA: GIY-YIG nuclease family protein [Tepidisphaeraceae bacterium]|nr:GIY-YIG nuclease family protein [Tepidisphaeraceae bacterium]
MIYFVQDSRTFDIKIGHAADVASRVSSLQTGNPGRLVILLAIPGDEPQERALHRSFCGVRVHGEWFRPGPDLLKLIIREACAAERSSSYHAGFRDGYYAGFNAKPVCVQEVILEGSLNHESV